SPFGRNSSVTTSPQKSTMQQQPGGLPTGRPQRQSSGPLGSQSPSGGPLRSQPQSSSQPGLRPPSNGRSDASTFAQGSTMVPNSSPFPSSAQAPNTPRSFDFSAGSVPE